MARLSFLAFVALFCTFVSVAVAEPSFEIFGKVYCDTCRAGFETKVTEYIEGAKVRLECKHFINGNVEYTADGITDKSGVYRIELNSSHGEDICEMVLVESPIKGCSEIAPGRDRARIVLTADTGISNNKRFANPLGYLKDKPLDVCTEVMKLYNFDAQE